MPILPTHRSLLRGPWTAFGPRPSPSVWGSRLQSCRAWPEFRECEKTGWQSQPDFLGSASLSLLLNPASLPEISSFSSFPDEDCPISR